MFSKTIITNAKLLSMIKSLWQAIGEISYKSKTIKLIEKQIVEVIATYNTTKEEIVTKLRKITSALDNALETEKELKKEIVKLIEISLNSLEIIGLSEIKTKVGDEYNQKIHRVMGVKHRAGQEGRILEIENRGFQGNQKIIPVEVVVGVCKEHTCELKSKEIKMGLVKQKRVISSFDGGDVTSDAGVLLLKEVDKTIGLVGKFADAIEDKRDKRYVTHEIKDLLAQRIYQIAMGYEDCNDCNFLRRDPAFKIALQEDILDGKDLASQPTMSRFENSITEEDNKRISEVFLNTFMQSYETEPEVIVLDFDTTEDTTHGDQEKTLFHAGA